eukprot:jgi/Picsp_1/4815/NSC_02183-R1_cyclin-dependent kinase g-2-like
MSSRFGNPLLAEAIRLAKAKELAKKKEGEEEGKISKNEGNKKSYVKNVKSGTSRWEVSQEESGKEKSGKHHSPIRWDNNLKGDSNGHENGARGSFQTKMAERAHAEIQAFRQRMAEVKAAGEDKGKAPEEMVRNSDFGSEVASAHVSGDVAEERDLGADLDELDSDEPSGSMQAEEEAEMGPERPIDTLQESEVVEAYPEMSQSSTSMEVDSSGSDAKDDDDDDTQHCEEASVPFKRRISMLNECRSVENYEKLNRISEGTYGVVYRARDLETGEMCALKKLKLDKEQTGFPLTSIREINILLALEHPSIVNVSEVVMGTRNPDPRDDMVFMVMEYADHDLKAVMDKRMKQPFSIAEVKCLMTQLLSGIAYLHENWVLHRDLKTSNILYTNKGQLKICDFGLARQYSSYPKQYTRLVVTLWYRAPELLLGTRKYSTAVDMWSVGCIMAELLSKKPIFNGQSEIQQLDLIFKTLGYPNEETWPGVSEYPYAKKMKITGPIDSLLRKKFPPPGPVFDGRPTLSDSGFDLLTRLLAICPERRISAEEALQHRWFQEHPLPKDPTMMPTFPGTNESLHGRRHR